VDPLPPRDAITEGRLELSLQGLRLTWRIPQWKVKMEAME